MRTAIPRFGSPKPAKAKQFDGQTRFWFNKECPHSSYFALFYDASCRVSQRPTSPGRATNLRKTNAHTFAPPDAPQNVRVKSTEITGQLQILLGKVPRAVFYEVEWTFDPVNGPWTMVPAFNSTRGLTLDGLTRGKDYFIRVRAVTTGASRGPWSDIANAMVV